MRNNVLRKILFVVYLVGAVQPLYSMVEPDEVEELVAGVANINLHADYYSDSEDEEGYTYAGLPPLVISDAKEGTSCIPLLRGIHFSPSKFTRHDISACRRANEAGQDIFSSAAYDLANEPLGNHNNDELVREKAEEVREIISALPLHKRNKFQEIYSNQYDRFHGCLGTGDEGGIFENFESQKNPQVSTAENFFHAGKYASGKKFLGANVACLDPEYDATGKPKHPYLGKLYVILASTDEIQQEDPYFVVHGHGNDDITISSHYSKNVLAEREVSFPGFVSGDCVVLSTPLRVPSFAGDYKPWYQEKFGISKRVYNARKKILTTGKYFKNDGDDDEAQQALKMKTVVSLLNNIILPHAEKKLKQHLARECALKNINLVYKQLDGSFGRALPALPNVADHKKQIKQRKEA